MSNTAEVICEAVFEAKDQDVPSNQPWASSETVNTRFTIPFLTKPYDATVLAGPEQRSSECPRKDREKNSPIAMAKVGILFTTGFILGGSCWIGLETLAVNVFQYIAA